MGFINVEIKSLNTTMSRRNLLLFLMCAPDVWKLHSVLYTVFCVSSLIFVTFWRVPLMVFDSDSFTYGTGWWPCAKTTSPRRGGILSRSETRYCHFISQEIIWSAKSKRYEIMLPVLIVTYYVCNCLVVLVLLILTYAIIRCVICLATGQCSVFQSECCT